MRARSPWLLLLWGLAGGPCAAAAEPTLSEVRAEPPSDLSVTIYRAPSRGEGSIDLDELQGFALVSETRSVLLPAGESRVRFEGVADGIEPESAIVTGFEHGILEKNRDAALLSPSALIAAALGKSVMLIRTDRKRGTVERLPGTILSDADGGVIFKTEAGIEALRCSGLAETVMFDSAGTLAAHPTLSVRVQTSRAGAAQVTLSYLSKGFDWAADYTATVAADGRTLSLGAWVTLANGNGVGFPDAHTQVVAGRLNRESEDEEPMDEGSAILARCWPRGSTSDAPAQLLMGVPVPLEMARKREIFPMAALGGATQEVVVTAMRVSQEQLGDLKLYRVPDRTTVASRQSKQVRLLDRAGIPFTAVYRADLGDADGVKKSDEAPWTPASKWLRTKNETVNHLGLPLPSGQLSLFQTRGSEPLLIHQSGLRDLAVGEDVELDAGPSADVNWRAVRAGDSRTVDITNTRATPIDFELAVGLAPGARVIRADRPVGSKNGRPLFRINVPGQSTVTLHFELTASRGAH